jgi:tRNA threonylcarbamoyladenosine biosynthesis protein TsaB
MTVLALDTCCGAFSFALFKEGKMILHNRHEIPNKQAELLIYSLQSELELAQMSFFDIHQIVVTMGPGSFTGIRIGLAAAHGLALATKAEVYGLTTLDAMLQQIPNATHAVLNAGKGQYYMKEATSSPSDYSSIKLVDAEELDAMLNDSTIVLAGNHPQALQTMPGAQALAELFHSLQVKDDVLQFKDPEPLYIRQPDAVAVINT